MVNDANDHYWGDTDTSPSTNVTGTFKGANQGRFQSVADQITPFVPAGLRALGTDGFGRSATREALRRFFEADAGSICVAALYELRMRSSRSPSRPMAPIRQPAGAGLPEHDR